MGEVSPLIQVKGVYKSFASGEGTLDVLSGVDLEVKAGDMVGIVGASGVGKSTLLHIIGTLEKPSKGSVLFESVDVFKLPEKELAEFRNRNIGFIFQFHNLLPEFTALENAVMPALINGMSMKEATTATKELLSELGLAERLNHKPGELSGGEQQRVAIARALVNKPRVVLADEPTGNLDSKAGEEIHNLLRRLNATREQSFVIVTHNYELANCMDLVFHLVDGKVSRLGEGDCNV